MRVYVKRVEVGDLVRRIVAVALLACASKVFGGVDMTGYVEMHQYDSGAWRFENTSSARLKCHIGLVATPRWSTSLPPMSPSLSDSPIEVQSTIGTRNFFIEPRGVFFHARNDVGTVQCKVTR